MAKNFCPTCGAEQKFHEAEICPSCGVRVRDPPTPRWAYIAAGGFIAGFAALIVLVFLLVVWQGSLHAGPAPAVTPVPTGAAVTTSPTPAVPAINIPETHAMPENDFISDLA